MKHKILIIDDDEALSGLLKKYLELENYEVTLKHDGASGLQEALDGSYNLIVLDIMLPKMNGFDVLTQLRKSQMVPVLMLTAKDSELDKVLGLRLGADDYLTKPFSTNEFVARVQSLIRRATLFNQVADDKKETLEIAGLKVDKASREVMAEGHRVELTAKEFDLLYYLMSHKGQVFTKKQIYKAVWEDEYAFDDNNIMVHIRRLRKKIEPNAEEPFYIQTVWGVGYKFGGELK